MSLKLLGLLSELPLLLLYAFYHVLIRGREGPPCNPFDYSHTGVRGDLLRALLAGAASGPALRLARSTGKKCDRQPDCAPARVFLPDLARPGAPETLSGRSGARFSRPK